MEQKFQFRIGDYFAFRTQLKISFKEFSFKIENITDEISDEIKQEIKDEPNEKVENLITEMEEKILEQVPEPLFTCSSCIDAQHHEMFHEISYKILSENCSKFQSSNSSDSDITIIDHE